ncbi:uncharacterized protein V6R79_009386 [Siganus canaliculatus]
MPQIIVVLPLDRALPLRCLTMLIIRGGAGHGSLESTGPLLSVCCDTRDAKRKHLRTGPRFGDSECDRERYSCSEEKPSCRRGELGADFLLG